MAASRCAGMPLPRMYKIRQRFASQRLADAGRATAEALAGCGVSLQPGQRVAIAVGSRGIADLNLITRAVVDWTRAQGAEPFLVPAMGSHGGATAEGQKQVLEGYGLTPQGVGAPIRSSLEVVELPRGDLPIPVYFDQCASEADAVLVINRVKPHTSFHGRFESGLMKMIAIGLGKHAQATAIHQHGLAGLRELMPRIAMQILARTPIVLGIAVVENALDEPMLIEAIPAARIAEVEPGLLELARRNMPCLPTDRLDLLIVDRMGKDISGLGMDPNIIGRLKIRGQSEPDRPDIRLILARELSAGSHGNAIGVGLADIITRRLFEQIDLRATYENVLTSTFNERGKLPLIADDDRQAVEFALRLLAAPQPELLRVARIRDTLHLQEVCVSQAVLDELKAAGDAHICGPVEPLFTASGELNAW